MITLIQIRLLDNKNVRWVWVNMEAIDAFYQDTEHSYGILLRNGIVYHIDNAEFSRLIKVINK
jgi:hypothetical protein